MDGQKYFQLIDFEKIILNSWLENARYFLKNSSPINFVRKSMCVS